MQRNSRVWGRTHWASEDKMGNAILPSDKTLSTQTKQCVDDVLPVVSVCVCVCVCVCVRCMWLEYRGGGGLAAHVDPVETQSQSQTPPHPTPPSLVLPDYPSNYVT